jgi:iron complex outermembrane receptor protein
VPAYTAVDARFGLRLRQNLELSVAGLNLFDADHAEYGPIATRSRIPRSVFVQLLLQL